MATSAEFVGPLDRAGQSWSDEVYEVDCIAALSEHPDAIIRRREAAIASYHCTVAVLTLAGDLGAAAAVAFGAVAEARALAAFKAVVPCYGVGSDWRQFGG